MTIVLDNIGFLSDLLIWGAPILLGLSAAAYLILLLSWQQTPSSAISETRTHKKYTTAYRCRWSTLC